MCDVMEEQQSSRFHVLKSQHYSKPQTVDMDTDRGSQRANAEGQGFMKFVVLCEVGAWGWHKRSLYWDSESPQLLLCANRPCGVQSLGWLAV